MGRDHPSPGSRAFESDAGAGGAETDEGAGERRIALLTTRGFAAAHGEALAAVAREAGVRVEAVAVGADGPLVPPETLERVEIAFLPAAAEGDATTRRFFGAALRAPGLRWLHLGFVGLDHPIFARVAERGVALSNSPGASAEAIAQTAIGGVLALARGFPRWAEMQRRKRWSPHPPECVPRDLRGQTLLLLGVGAIGGHVARLARALGLRVVGVRRSPLRDDDELDELHAPAALPGLLPRADWLVLACPLTEETRGWIDAAALRALPRGAHLVNVARGPLVDEAALVAALRDGHLAGAYLDVFETEPLPEDSPLWELPNVIVTPHDSSASRGNAGRSARIFLESLGRWLRGEPLANRISFVPHPGGPPS